MGGANSHLELFYPGHEEEDYTEFFESYLSHFSIKDLDAGLGEEVAEPTSTPLWSNMMPWPSVSPRFKYYAEGARQDRNTYTNTTTGFGTFHVNHTNRSNASDIFAQDKVYNVRVQHATMGNNDAACDIRAMSIKFMVQGAVSPLDLILTTGKGAPFRNAYTYSEFSYAVADELQLKQYLRRNPLSFNAMKHAVKEPPSSFASLYYYDHNTYSYVSQDGKLYNIRIRVRPEKRDPKKDEDEDILSCFPWERGRVQKDPRRADLGPDYLHWEYVDSIRKGTIKYVLQMKKIISEASELEQHMPFMLPNVSWPDEWEDIGPITIDSVCEDGDFLYFSPTNTPKGMDVLPWYTPNDYTTAYHLRCYYSPTTMGVGNRTIHDSGLIRYRIRMWMKGGRGKLNDAAVSVMLHGENGRSPWLRVPNWSTQNFNSPDGIEFYVYHSDFLSRFIEVTFKLEAYGLFTTWFVTCLEVTEKINGDCFTFLGGRWLGEGETSFHEKSCLLPHSEPCLAAKHLRRASIASQKKNYRWTDNSSRNLPTHLNTDNGLMLSEKPADSEFEWSTLNRYALTQLITLTVENRPHGSATSVDAFLKLQESLQQTKWKQGPAPWENDAMFAEMFFLGPFANLLRYLPENSLPERWREPLRAMKVDLTKIFIVDVASLLENLPCQPGRVVYPARVVFAASPQGMLQLGLINLIIAGREYMYTPAKSSKNDWLLAKMHAASAVAHVHIIGKTFVQCYFAMEPVMIALRRNLSECHPVYKLMVPHLEGLLYACHNLRTQLLPELPQYFSLTSDGIQTLIERVYSTWTLAQNRPSIDANSPFRIFPYFPPRDDANQLWGVLHNFVYRILDYYYVHKANDVACDAEWASFLQDLFEIGYKNKGGLLGNLSPHSNLDDVYTLLTTVLYTVTVLQSTLTQGVWVYCVSVPLLPLSIHRSSTFDNATPGMVLESLPTLDLAMKQLAFLRAWTQSPVSVTSDGIPKLTPTTDMLGKFLKDDPSNIQSKGKKVFMEDDLFANEHSTIVYRNLRGDLFAVQRNIRSPLYSPVFIPNKVVK